MKVETYLQTVTDQIRCKKARELVGEELREHIFDQANAYQEDGMYEEEAMEKAVQEMGDPISTGISLDRIHRPQISWGILLLVGIISILGICIQAMIGQENPDFSVDGYLYLNKYILFTIVGYLLMVLVYRLDYSFLAKYGKVAAAGFLIFIIGASCFTGAGVRMNGMLYLNLGVIHCSVPILMYLYVPLYGAVLYAYRGEGYLVILKMLIWSMIPLLFTLHLPSISSFMLLSTAFMGLFSLAIIKGWYQVNRKWLLILMWTGLLLLPLFCLFTGNLAEYQVLRLRALYTRNPNSFWDVMLQSLLNNSCLIGGAGIGEDMVQNVWNTLATDFLPIYLISTYGILFGVLVVGIVGFLTIKIFHISLRQKNQLGMMIGCGCGLILLLQILLSVAVNLRLIPYFSINLPFLTPGGTELLVSYILLGFVLSVYRYKNILSDKTMQKRMQMTTNVL